MGDIHLIITYYNILLYHVLYYHRGTKSILLFFQEALTLQSRGVVTLFHLFTIAMYGWNCFIFIV